MTKVVIVFFFFFFFRFLYFHTETNRLGCSKQFRNVSFKRKTLFTRISEAIILTVMLNKRVFYLSKTNKYLYEGRKSLYFCLFGAGNDLESFLKFSSLSLNALFRLFQFLSHYFFRKRIILHCYFEHSISNKDEIFENRLCKQTGILYFQEN